MTHMDNCLAQLQMYDYLLKKYRNKEVSRYANDR